MSIWGKIASKLGNWKVLTGALAGVAVVYVTYKALSAEVQPTTLTPQQRFKRDVDKLKSRINLQQLGKSDLKEIFEFLMRETQLTLSDQNLSNKIERRALKAVDFKNYLKCLVDGFVKMQELTLKVSAQVMESLGIPEQRFQMACAQHPEITNFIPHLEPVGLFRELDLTELRQAILFQKVYMENHGQELVDKIKAETSDWDPTAKRMLPIVVGMVLGDELYEEMGLEDEQIQQARGKYQAEVRHQLQSAQNVLTPFLQQLDSAGNPFAAMGGFDPNMMGMDPSMLGNLDPAAMENFMNMMGMDPSMLEGFDPSLLGFDPNMMGAMMGGGMPMGNPFEGHQQVIDPTLMQQVDDDPEAQRKRMNMMMHH